VGLRANGRACVDTDAGLARVRLVCVCVCVCVCVYTYIYILCSYSHMCYVCIASPCPLKAHTIAHSQGSGVKIDYATPRKHLQEATAALDEILNS